MPNFDDAPWNKPVEEEGRELRDSDVPSRRGSSKDTEDDPLTELIFDSVSFDDDFTGTLVSHKGAGDTDPLTRELFSGASSEQSAQKAEEVQEDAIREDPEDRAEPSARMNRSLDGATSSASHKEMLQARLARYEEREKELRAQLAQSTKPSARSGVDAVASETKPVSIPEPEEAKETQTQEVQDGVVPQKKTESVAVEPEPKKPEPDEIQKVASPETHGGATVDPVVASRAQENWFGARPDGIQAPQPASLPSVDMRRAETLQEDTDETRWGRRVFLASVGAVVIAAGVWGAAQTNVASSFSSYIGGLFNSSSFVAGQGEAEETFPPLFLLREEAALAGTPVGDELAATLDTFFEKNQSFAWLNIFRPAEVRADGSRSVPTDLALLNTALALKGQLEEETGVTTRPSDGELASYIEWLSFLQALLGTDGRYLVLTGSGERVTPAGGEPMVYSELVVSGGTVHIERSGSVADLNAALAAKVTPPEAVQVVKTGMDFHEAMWFLDFNVAGEVAADLYEQTTQRTIDGVFLLSASGTKRIAESEDATLSPEEAGWLNTLVNHLGAARVGEHASFARALTESFERNELQLYFKNTELASFVDKKNLAVDTALNTQDALAVGVRTWEGDGVDLKLVEHRPTFFADGSVTVQARTHLSNTDEESRRVYIKTYIPTGSFLLGQDGFSVRPPVPDFNYGEHGFSTHPAVTALQESQHERFPQLDVFKEGDYMVVGGWVDIPAGTAHVAALEYRLSERLAWERGTDEYTLDVVRSGAFKEFPFHFSATFEEGVTFSWREPQGFLTAGAAEYQQELTDDVTLRAELNFTKNDVSN